MSGARSCPLTVTKPTRTGRECDPAQDGPAHDAAVHDTAAQDTAVHDTAAQDTAVHDTAAMASTQHKVRRPAGGAFTDTGATSQLPVHTPRPPDRGEGRLCTPRRSHSKDTHTHAHTTRPAAHNEAHPALFCFSPVCRRTHARHARAHRTRAPAHRTHATHTTRTLRRVTKGKQCVLRRSMLA